MYGSGDKETLFLPKVQERLLTKLLDLGKPVIAVISAGSAISLNGLDKHPNLQAILHTWYPGSFGGKALAEILFGKVSPSGKLPVTFYHDTTNLPDFSDYSMKKRTYRYLEEEALYPFGFGLTYGNVTLDDLTVTKKQLDSIDVTVTVTNHSDTVIEEVIQVYAKTDSKFEVPETKLIGFKRLALKAAATERLTLNIPMKNLTVVNDDGERLLDGTKATIYVNVASPSARSEVLTGCKTLTDTIDINEYN